MQMTSAKLHPIKKLLRELKKDLPIKLAKRDLTTNETKNGKLYN